MTHVVHIVDDDDQVRKSLARLLSSEGLDVVSSKSAEEFLGKLDSSVPGCLILDLAMPQVGGLELQQLLAARNVSLPIVFLTGCGDVHTSVHAMKGGAVDFLTKPVDAQDLLAAVRKGIVAACAAHEGALKRARTERLLATLTPREREVLPHLLTGRLNKQIAADLGIVEKTIKVHRSRVMHKLQVRSVAELVRLAGSLEMRTSRR